jgi:hypothetical protein
MPPAEAQEQLALFDLGVDVMRLRTEREKLNGHRRAPATRRALESDWRHFGNFKRTGAEAR